MTGLAILFLCPSLFIYGSYLLVLPLNIVWQALRAYLNICVMVGFRLPSLALDFIDQMMLKNPSPHTS
jgi:hypothetical protein